jgi:hypothetical protein
MVVENNIGEMDLNGSAEEATEPADHVNGTD